MTKLEKYELVNQAENEKELADAILKLADPETGKIKGRAKDHDGKRMVERLSWFMEGKFPPNGMTREFGIRQQAMYIKYYQDIERIHED
jgi:hypothetical protein